MSEAKLTQRREGRVLILTLDNPAQRNALGPGMYTGGIEAFDLVAKDKSIGAVILTGRDGTFCAGGNLNRLNENRKKTNEFQREAMNALLNWVRAIRSCEVPVIAVVEGAAAGAGCSIALSCDLIVSAEDAVFALSYVKVGLNPDGGATTFLARALPPQLASEILFEGGKITPQRLHQAGVVNRLTPSGQALEVALVWAEKLANGPRAAMGRAKKLLEEAYGDDLSGQLDREADAFVDALHHDEAGEGIAAFLEKRKPDFSWQD